MKRLAYGLVLTLALAVGGCATVVPQQDVPVDKAGLPSLETVVERIKCELAETLHESPRNYRVLMSNDIDVALQLSLTVSDSGGLAPSLTYIHPPFFSFNAAANYSRSRDQNYFEKLYFSMRELDLEIQDGKILKCPVVETNLAGNLGLRESFDLAMTSLDRLQWDGQKLTGGDGTFGGYVNFVVTRNVNMVGPTWMLTNFKGPGSLANLSEVNTDKITFAFARGAAAGKPYDRIARATNLPAESLLAQININQLSTELARNRQATQ